MSKLTLTSYALLGILSRQPWSAYELNKWMQQSMVRASCPRVESRVYSEIKNLRDHGLATCHKERQGNRERSVYTITERGRETLQDWLHTEGDRMRVEYETLLKLSFAEQAEPELMDDLIDALERQACTDLQTVINTCESVVEQGGWREANTGHLNVLMVRFITELAEARLRWAQQARAFVAGLDPVDTQPQSLDVYREEIARLKALIASVG